MGGSEVCDLVEAEQKRRIEKMAAWLDKKRAQIAAPSSS